ncbi:MAG: hypothetical protein HYY51_01615 [Candidatus Magasanikbacteria bacterium]|nr:hypothetical protein [Candidatus Magasanikbacteria bacterium]
MVQNQNDPHPLTRERKVGFVFLLLFAILTVSLGALQLRNTIYGPFAKMSSKDDLNKNELFLDETLRLQRIDTDQDGINDYEELNFYETSPYLPDTDSDGVEDKKEIDSGTDPLCPEGSVCALTETASGASPKASIGSPLLESTPSVGEVLFGKEAPDAGSSVSQIDTLLKDPAQLRSILMSTGKIKKEELEKFSDQELLGMVQSLIKDQKVESLFFGSEAEGQ